MHLALLAVSGALTTVVLPALMERRLRERVDEALHQEIAEVHRFVESGIDPTTGERFSSVQRLLEVYLERNVPSLSEAFVALSGERVLRERLRSFPGQALPAAAEAELAAFSSGRSGPEDEQAGRFETAEGAADYRAVRISIGGETGAFVIALLPAAERREINDTRTYSAVVAVGVVVVAGSCAWFLTGRVLAPVRNLTQTARAISQSNRSRRIEVRGSVEAEEMAETFNAMLDRLDQAHHDQLEFLRAVGHELRAALTVATGQLEVAAMTDDEPDETVAIVLDELTRMGRMVDDLQCLAESIQADFLRPGPVDLARFGQELLAKAQMLGHRDWRLDLDAEGVVLADRHRLTQAVLNLADNAAKNTTPGARIEIGMARSGDALAVWVADDGVGIPVEEQARVFERFVRGRDATHRYRGTGLGLTIVAVIAEAHGGYVQVDSEAGRGARFSLFVTVRPWLAPPGRSTDVG
jgi:signal transduction histidine kinase